VDVVGYWSVVREYWPWLDVRKIHRLAIAGKIFRYLDAIYWDLPGFKYEWWKKLMINMRTYKSWLADAIRAAKLKD
jgi:hypothetical protein